MTYLFNAKKNTEYMLYLKTSKEIGYLHFYL